MTFDARFTSYDDCESRIATGEVFIIDAKGVSFRHFLKIARNVGTVKLYMRFLQEAAPIRIKQNNFINCSSIIDRMLALMRPFLKRELLDVIRLHPQGIDTLDVCKEVLPFEYGGTAGAIDEIYKEWMETFNGKR